MTRPNYSPAEVAQKLALFHAFRADGMRVHEITRRLGITDTTLYNWLRASQETPFDAALLKRENARLKKLVEKLQVKLATGSKRSDQPARFATA